MRKRISCKVVRSVTLGKTDDGLQRMSRSGAERRENSCTASLTYTARLVVTRTDIDDCHAVRTLDFCV